MASQHEPSSIPRCRFPSCSMKRTGVVAESDEDPLVGVCRWALRRRRCRGRHYCRSHRWGLRRRRCRRRLHRRSHRWGLRRRRCRRTALHRRSRRWSLRGRRCRGTPLPRRPPFAVGQQCRRLPAPLTNHTRPRTILARIAQAPPQGCAFGTRSLRIQFPPKRHLLCALCVLWWLNPRAATPRAPGSSA